MKVLVVGGGLAGICLTHEWMKLGHDATLIDNSKNVSSAVAAGIINPLVFRRMTLSWRVDELLPYAEKTYRELENKVQAHFFHPLPIRRLFASEQERGFWIKKQGLPIFNQYMSELTEEDQHFPSELNTFGTGRVKQAAYVDTIPFIEKNKTYLRKQRVLLEEEFDYNQLNPDKAIYRGTTYDFIIFSQGKDGKYNPFFSYLPLNQTKGEVLTIQSDYIYSEESLNRKCFLLPLGNGLFKVGSTYVWNTDDSTPTEEGKVAICSNLLSINNEPYEIIEQRAGVRPTVLDRRPLLGKHPVYPKLVIANGLGTKGFMIAPLLMHELVMHLTQGEVLNPESSIERFANLV